MESKELVILQEKLIEALEEKDRLKDEMIESLNSQVYSWKKLYEGQASIIGMQKTLIDSFK